MPRTPLVVGNWKMHFDLDRATKAAIQLKNVLGDLKSSVDIAIAPPLPWLVPVEAAFGRTQRLELAAQDAVPGTEGNETGSVSMGMLRDHVRYVLIGHSERRLGKIDTHETINAKVKDALRRKITPIVCVGEFVHLYDRSRRRGRPTKLEAESNIFMQLRRALRGVKREEMSKVVVAYEPVWAIDTGTPAEPDYVEIMVATLRRAIAKLSSKRIAANTRILYGGSVNGKNAADYAARPGIDGALVGSASRDPKEFAKVVAAFASK